MRILSTNLGSPEPCEGGKGIPTGIGKVPVDALDVRAPGPKHGGLGSGAIGDFIGDVQHHGGDDQALYAVAREELDWWGAELGRDLPDGMFGENLTTIDVPVDDARIGEVWTIGEVVVRVTGPRIPCVTFATRMGERGWVKRFSERGNTGAYLAVDVPGTIHCGDAVTITHRPEHDIDVPLSFRAFMGDVEAARHVLGAQVFSGPDQQLLEEVAARR